MKLELKSSIAKPKVPKPDDLPTSMQIKGIPSLSTPKINEVGTKFRYKGAREK